MKVAAKNATIQLDVFQRWNAIGEYQLPQSAGTRCVSDAECMIHGAIEKNHRYRNLSRSVKWAVLGFPVGRGS